MKKFFVFILFTISIAQSQVIMYVDTGKVWANGWNACYKLLADDSIALATGNIFEAGYRAGRFNGSIDRPSVNYAYFSTSAIEDTIGAWLRKGYLILYFGTKSSTTNKISIRGMKPR
jgi:hypothetical protein